MHINELELLALQLALETFLKVQEIESLLIQMDNIVALTYFLKMGRHKKFTNGLSFQTNLGTAIKEKVTVTGEYLPRTLNRHADIESRRKTNS